MCESEFVILCKLDNNVYCQERTFALGSVEAKTAHAIISKERENGNNIIDINELSKEEIDEVLAKIKNRIEKTKANLILLKYWEEKYEQIMEIANTRVTYKF